MIELKHIIYDEELETNVEAPFYDIVLRDYTVSYEDMADSSITSEVYSNILIEPEEWIGECFIVHRGETWRIYKSPVRSEENTVYKYKYNITLKTAVEQTKTIKFLDLVLGSSISSGLNTVQFYGNIEELANRIQANLNNRLSGWSIIIHETVDTSLYKDISLDNVFVYDAIQSIYNDYKIKYKIIGKTIYIGYDKVTVPYTFSFGKDNGLYSISKTPTDDTILAYIRGCGSTKNMPINYYTTGTRFSSNPCPRYTQNLLPAIYTQGATGVAIWERDYYQDDDQVASGNINDDFIIFDGSENEEIYPTIQGAEYNGLRIDKLKAVGEIGSDIINADGSIKDSSFQITLNPLGFDASKLISNQGELTVSMKTGDCAGCDFKVLKINGINTNPAKATNAFGASKTICDITNIMTGTEAAIPISSFYRYALDGNLNIENAYLGVSGFGVNDNNNNTDEYTLTIRTFLYNSITQDVVEVDSVQFVSPTYPEDQWDLTGEQYITAKSIPSAQITVGSWTLYVEPSINITDGLAGNSQKTIQLRTLFSGEEPLMTAGDITKDGSITVPSNEDVVLTVEKSINDFNTLMPNATLKPVAGDEFVFINAKMPDEYFIYAEQRLGAALQAYLANNSFEKYNYNISLDSKIIGLDESIQDAIEIGNTIQLEELAEELDIVNISIEHKDSQIFDTYEIKISNTSKKPIGFNRTNRSIQRLSYDASSTQKAVVSYANSLRSGLNSVAAKSFSAPVPEEVSGGSATLDANTLGATIAGAVEKNNPADVDKFVLSDSAATNVAKHITWAYIKSRLKTYFDTLYGVTASSLGTLINGTSTRTLANADLIPVTNSSSSHILSKITWSNLKSEIATALNTTFAAYSHNHSGTYEPVISTKGTAFNSNFETSTTNIKMDGTVSVGSSDNVPRADHTHPTDTSRAAKNGNSSENFAANQLSCSTFIINGWTMTVNG